ncbi:tetratricopeptide repeat protein [Streptomyces telluris]|uniref:Tetratricopeptide repeat protein n=1 Tax=Streptomyces telluris TaxID=2720021 RepID=A0A9X2RQ35_9ACTN|nr:tetratricopeptide repeat protein [Streptomyces telluris]MCQ8772081.1 tetratricopeptide repeat protein [Streptomyces telluris]NJP78535.1 tetratricopeptide repeat protein [Streptomyces telluris]
MEKFLRTKGTIQYLDRPMEEPPQGAFVPEPTPRSRELLTSYFDLETPGGPLHAKCTADVGRRLAEGLPIPVYQIASLGLLREALKAEQPAQPNPDDPRDLPKAMRSAPWNHLCDMADNWGDLSVLDRSRLVTALAKLGFWNSVADLVPADGGGSSLDALRLAYFRHNADAQLAPDARSAAAAFVRARSVMETIARSEDFDPVVRYGAAAHMIVLCAKGEKEKALADMRHWLQAADAVAARAGKEMEPLHTSIYWRGVAFIPFFEGNHAEVKRQLELSEKYAMEAVEAADADTRLLALENVHPVLETSGRSAKARGDIDGAEQFYRRMTEWDPLDPKAHVRLADFLMGENRVAEARDAYSTAARLGAPYASYAHCQAARCSIRLDEAEHAYAALVASAALDRRALSPLILLRDICTTEVLAPLKEWAVHELAARMQEAR